MSPPPLGPPPISPALRRQLGYRKFGRAAITALVFDSGYHCQAELAAGLAALGHRVVSLAVAGPQGVRTPGEAMRVLLRALLRHRPDLVVSVNHIGFDADGVMGGLLDGLEVPVAVWYVDSPFFIHEGFFLAAPEMTTVWSWERTYLPLLRRLGARDAQHLPLACHPERLTFVPAAEAAAAEPRDPASDARPSPAPRPRGDVTFVGSSLGDKSGPWWRHLSRQEAAHSRQLAATLAAGQDLLAALGEPRPSPDRRMTLLAQACLEATARRRQQLLAALAPTPLCVVGDAAWRRRLPRARWLPQVSYGPALARLYAGARVNLNITSLQMPTAVNQRVFDVPMAGGFLLTDAQADQAELFSDDALATYQGADSLVDEARFYLARPQLCRAISLRARAGVVARHTYAHRAAKMVEHMRARWRG